MFKFRGKRPKNLGVVNGQLKAPPAKPNCAHSQASKGYAAIEPLSFDGDAQTAWERLLTLVEGEAEIITREAAYAHAEYSSKLMGYVDDVEFYCPALDGKDEAGVIHLRSASRLGYSDMGANRKRVEALRKRFS